MGLFDFIGPASGLLFTLENIIWINLGVFIGCVFAAIPGLSVILCIILFLPVTYTMRAIPGMMFLLGIYCAGGYGGSVSAILINTPGTPHAAATMLDGYPLSKMGRTKAALKIALYASTFGGIFSALVLLFLGPQVAKISAQLGTAEYFMVCLFGMTIIAGVSGKSLVKGIIAACLGLLISCVGADPMTSYDRFTFGIPRLYLGLDLAVTLIGLFALDYLDQYTGEKPFFMTVSQIEPHHQNDHNHYEGPNGSKQRFADFVLPEDLKALGGNAAEEYPDYLGQCASLDENLGKLVEKLKEKGLYENTVILYASDHGSHFKTRNRDAHLNGYDDYKRSCHDGCLHVPLVICGGPFKGGKEVTELVSTESIPKTLLALAGVDVGDKMIGENLLDVVEKKNHNRANEVYAQISESRCGRCIRTADYMYSVYAPGVNGGEAAASDVYADDFLYDMQKDPWQLNNVVADPAYADVKAELRERLLNWIQHAEGTRPTITD